MWGFVSHYFFEYCSAFSPLSCARLLWPVICELLWPVSCCDLWLSDVFSLTHRFLGLCSALSYLIFKVCLSLYWVVALLLFHHPSILSFVVFIVVPFHWDFNFDFCMLVAVIQKCNWFLNAYLISWSLCRLRLLIPRVAFVFVFCRFPGVFHADYAICRSRQFTSSFLIFVLFYLFCLFC